MARGYVFRSRTDTEVILYGYHVWGCEVFSRLRGMISLALWDRDKRRLVLARDRLGKKPLYDGWASGAFLFGSEIKAILAWPDYRRVPDLAAIDQYLTLQYISASGTAFTGVQKLPPAHYMIL